MSSEFGKNLRISIFGESHGAAIGVVVDGLPVGETVDLDALAAFLARRAPGRNAMSTARKETDAVRVLSGLYQGKTSGAPLCMVIENRNAHSNDYERLRHIPRPAHADYSASVRYHGFSDLNGGGHFSGRLTAPLCAAGGVCLQILNRKGIAIGGHLSRCAGVDDAPIDSLRLTAEELAAVAQRPIPVLDENAGMRMQAAVQAAKEQGDSVGGVIEVFGLGIPAGLGSPMFGGVENRLAQAVFGIPAIRGVEFGADQPPWGRAWRHHDGHAARDARSGQTYAIHCAGTENAGSPNRRADRTLHHRAARSLHCAAGGALRGSCCSSGIAGFNA